MEVAMLRGMLAAAVAVVFSTPLHARSRQAAAPAENPFVGRWVVDLTLSKLDPKSSFKSATLTIMGVGEMVTMSSELVNASGKNQVASETFQTDGVERPGTLSPGVSHIARWLGTHVLTVIAMKNAEVFLFAIYHVSGDRKTLTARSSGAVEQVVVFDRK
jgi:hypothetical protein